MLYIQEQNRKNLKNFKYIGGTESISYQYLWSPFAEYLLQYFPEWIAPNMITSSALILLTVVHIIFMLPDPDNRIPNWKLVLMAVSILIYQHLDNIDGKQARKTKSSSALGMLFDHGSDAVSAFLLGLQVMKILQIPYEQQMLGIYLYVMSTYFFAMWSQYSVGYFKLGYINPVDEGLPIYAISCLIATQLDLTKASEFHIVGTYGQEIFWSLILFLIPQSYFMTKDIMKNAIIPKKQILYISLLYIITGAVLFATIQSLRPLTSSTFYPLFYSTMFMWSRNMILIQLQFVVQQKYNLFNRANVAYWSLCLFYVFAHSYLPISNGVYFTILCLLEGFLFFEFVFSVLKQGADILDIYIFTIKEEETDSEEPKDTTPESKEIESKKIRNKSKEK